MSFGGAGDLEANVHSGHWGIDLPDNPSFMLVLLFLRCAAAVVCGHQLALLPAITVDVLEQLVQVRFESGGRGRKHTGWRVGVRTDMMF